MKSKSINAISACAVTYILFSSAAATATANDIFIMQNFSCSFVKTAFEDERNFRKAILPPPEPEALMTLPTREIASFVAGFITAFSAIGRFSDVRKEPYNAYPPGLFAALAELEKYCIDNPSENLMRGLSYILTSEHANPIQKE